MSLIASAPINCPTAGTSWTQQWNCGWNANKTGAHVGSYGTALAGSHNMTGVFIFIGAIIGVLLIASMRRSGGGKPATAR